MPRCHASKALALWLIAGAVAAGPAIPCADGPDPLRFRPEARIGASAFVFGAGWTHDAAACVDPGTGREWVAIAFVDPADELQVIVSGDGGTTFGAASGGLDLTGLDPGGPVAREPRIAMRVDDGQPLLAVAWKQGDALAVAIATDMSGAFRISPLVAADVTSLSTSVAIAPRPAERRVVAAWMTEIPARALFVASNASEGDPGAWTTPVEVAPPAGEAYAPRRPETLRQVALSADAAGDVGSARVGVTLAVTTSLARAHVARSEDAGATFGAWRRVSDDTSEVFSAVSLASNAGGDSSWTMVGLSGNNFASTPPLPTFADTALETAGALDSEFDVPTGPASPSIGPQGATAPVGVAVAGPAPGTHAFVAITTQRVEVGVARRPLVDGRPRLAGGCSIADVTGIDPPRSSGYALEPAAAALGDDVAFAFVDMRSGSREVWFKRSDSSAPAVTALAATPNACGNPASVQLAWDPLPADVVLVEVDIGVAPGVVDSTRTVPVGSGVLVDTLLDGTVYYFTVRATDSAGNVGVSTEVSATTPTCTLALLRASISSVVDVCASGGGGDGLADPGENVVARIHVENVGLDPAPASSLRVTSLSPDAFTAGAILPAGDLGPGVSTDVDVTVDVSATWTCASPLQLRLDTASGAAAWSDVDTLPQGSTCSPCLVPTCAIVADTSLTAPTDVCGPAPVTLDATSSLLTDCPGSLLCEWSDGSGPIGSGCVVTVTPSGTTTYHVDVRCSTDLSCLSGADVVITVNPLPSAPQELKLAKAAAGQLAFTWLGMPPDVARIRSSLDVRDLTGTVSRNECEGGSTCSIAMPPDALRFFTAVSLCADGVTEGPP